ncbi:hypothetical protein PSPO01_12932 [Paraphaeosphaeria sporulosa]
MMQAACRGVLAAWSALALASGPRFEAAVPPASIKIDTFQRILRPDRARRLFDSYPEFSRCLCERAAGANGLLHHNMRRQMGGETTLDGWLMSVLSRWRRVQFQGGGPGLQGWGRSLRLIVLGRYTGWAFLSTRQQQTKGDSNPTQPLCACRCGDWEAGDTLSRALRAEVARMQQSERCPGRSGGAEQRLKRRPGD